MRVWIAERLCSDGRVLPLGAGGRLLLMTLALVIGTAIYHVVSWRLFTGYSKAFEEARVISSFLSAYPNSPQMGEVGRDTGSGERPTSLWRKVQILAPGDLLTLMVEAGITDRTDVAKPADILDLRVGGVGAWLASEIVSTKIIDNYSLARAWVSGEISCGEKAGKTPVSSLEGLVFLYKSVGRQGNGGDPAGQADRTTNRSECKAVVPDDVKKEAREFASSVTGKLPNWWSIGDGGGDVNTYGAVKVAMAIPWNLFDANNIREAKQEQKPAGKVAVDVVEFVGGDGEENWYQTSPGGPTLSQLRWFMDDPSEREAAVVKLSTLVIETIMSSDEVKTKRFLYQAWRGWIQWLIIVIFCYVVLQLVWRVFAGWRNRDEPRRRAFFGPLVTVGKVANWDDAVFQSRRFVDMWLSTLPLLGLLGTVLGILFGLPNAAAAINAKGPAAAASVNQLFEQLGLAFGTTALAVLSVVVLQVLWEVLQYYEDRFFARTGRGRGDVEGKAK